jgi:hypothetical protein
LNCVWKRKRVGDMEEEGECEGGMERESRGRREMRIGNLGEGR